MKIKKIGAVVGAAVLTGVAITALSGAAASAEPSAQNCWRQIELNGPVTKELCINGTDAQLKDAVYERYGLVIVWDPADAPATISAEKARAKKLGLKVRTSSQAAADATTPSTDPTDNVTPETAQTANPMTSSPDSASGTYILGILWSKTNYSGYKQIDSAAQSATCKKYYYKFHTFGGSTWPGGGIFDAVNDSVSSFQTGPNCKAGFWVDSDFRGSFYGNYTSRKSMDWMDNTASSYWYTG